MNNNIKGNNIYSGGYIISTLSYIYSCFIVDSTRNGKKIPDALSKTIPICMCVINRINTIIYPNRTHIDHTLYLPPLSVFSTEKSQIESLIDTFVLDALDSFIDWKTILMDLEKSLRPIWITPESTLFSNGSPWESISQLSFYPILLISASKTVKDGAERSVINNNHLFN